MPTVTTDLAARILALKEAVAKADQRRATAEAAVKFAQQQVGAIDEALRKLGIDPENADQQLADLEAQLEQALTQLEQKTAEADAEYTRIIGLAQQAGLAV